MTKYWWQKDHENYPKKRMGKFTKAHRLSSTTGALLHETLFPFPIQNSNTQVESTTLMTR